MKIDGTKYKCDRCGVEKFLSCEQMAMEGGLTGHGIFKVTVPKRKDLHFCESCFTEFLRFMNEMEKIE